MRPFVEGFFIHNKGIGTKEIGKLTTLKSEMEKFGWTDKNITYIKMDVEGAELEILPDWIKRGIKVNLLGNKSRLKLMQS